MIKRYFIGNILIFSTLLCSYVLKAALTDTIDDSNLSSSAPIQPSFSQEAFEALLELVRSNQRAEIRGEISDEKCVNLFLSYLKGSPSDKLVDDQITKQDILPILDLIYKVIRDKEEVLGFLRPVDTRNRLQRLETRFLDKKQVIESRRSELSEEEPTEVQAEGISDDENDSTPSNFPKSVERQHAVKAPRSSIGMKTPRGSLAMKRPWTAPASKRPWNGSGMKRPWTAPAAKRPFDSSAIKRSWGRNNSKSNLTQKRSVTKASRKNNGTTKARNESEEGQVEASGYPISITDGEKIIIDQILKLGVYREATKSYRLAPQLTDRQLVEIFVRYIKGEKMLTLMKNSETNKGSLNRIINFMFTVVRNSKDILENLRKIESGNRIDILEEVAAKNDEPEISLIPEGYGLDQATLDKMLLLVKTVINLKLKNPSSLTSSQLIDVFLRYIRGEKQQSLADEYGIGIGSISRNVNLVHSIIREHVDILETLNTIQKGGRVNKLEKNASSKSKKSAPKGPAFLNLEAIEIDEEILDEITSLISPRRRKGNHLVASGISNTEFAKIFIEYIKGKSAKQLGREYKIDSNKVLRMTRFAYIAIRNNEDILKALRAIDFYDRIKGLEDKVPKKHISDELSLLKEHGLDDKITDRMVSLVQKGLDARHTFSHFKLSSLALVDVFLSYMAEKPAKQVSEKYKFSKDNVIHYAKVVYKALLDDEEILSLIWDKYPRKIKALEASIDRASLAKEKVIMPKPAPLKEEATIKDVKELIRSYVEYKLAHTRYRVSSLSSTALTNVFCRYIRGEPKASIVKKYNFVSGAIRNYTKFVYESIKDDTDLLNFLRKRQESGKIEAIEKRLGYTNANNKRECIIDGETKGRITRLIKARRDKRRKKIGGHLPKLSNEQQTEVFVSYLKGEEVKSLVSKFEASEPTIFDCVDFAYEAIHSDKELLNHLKEQGASGRLQKLKNRASRKSKPASTSSKRKRVLNKQQSSTKKRRIEETAHKNAEHRTVTEISKESSFHRGTKRVRDRASNSTSTEKVSGVLVELIRNNRNEGIEQEVTDEKCANLLLGYLNGNTLASLVDSYNISRDDVLTTLISIYKIVRGKEEVLTLLRPIDSKNRLEVLKNSVLGMEGPIAKSTEVHISNNEEASTSSKPDSVQKRRAPKTNDNSKGELTKSSSKQQSATKRRRVGKATSKESTAHRGTKRIRDKSLEEEAFETLLELVRSNRKEEIRKEISDEKCVNLFLSYLKGGTLENLMNSYAILDDDILNISNFIYRVVRGKEEVLALLRPIDAKSRLKKLERSIPIMGKAAESRGSGYVRDGSSDPSKDIETAVSNKPDSIEARRVVRAPRSSHKSGIATRGTESKKKPSEVEKETEEDFGTEKISRRSRPTREKSRRNGDLPDEIIGRIASLAHPVITGRSTQQPALDSIQCTNIFVKYVKGETATSLAKEYGFADPRTISHHVRLVYSAIADENDILQALRMIDSDGRIEDLAGKESTRRKKRTKRTSDKLPSLERHGLDKGITDRIILQVQRKVNLKRRAPKLSPVELVDVFLKYVKGETTRSLAREFEGGHQLIFRNVHLVYSAVADEEDILQALRAIDSDGRIEELKKQVSSQSKSTSHRSEGAKPSGKPVDSAKGKSSTKTAQAGATSSKEYGLSKEIIDSMIGLVQTRRVQTKSPIAPRLSDRQLTEIFIRHLKGDKIKPTAQEYGISYGSTIYLVHKFVYLSVRSDENIVKALKKIDSDRKMEDLEKEISTSRNQTIIRNTPQTLSPVEQDGLDRKTIDRMVSLVQKKVDLKHRAPVVPSKGLTDIFLRNLRGDVQAAIAKMYHVSEEFILNHTYFVYEAIEDDKAILDTLGRKYPKRLKAIEAGINRKLLAKAKDSRPESASLKEGATLEDAKKFIQSCIENKIASSHCSVTRLTPVQLTDIFIQYIKGAKVAQLIRECKLTGISKRLEFVYKSIKDNTFLLEFLKKRQVPGQIESLEERVGCVKDSNKNGSITISDEAKTRITSLIKAARAKRKGGLPPKLSNKQQAEVLIQFLQGKEFNSLAHQYKISAETIRVYINYAYESIYGDKGLLDDLKKQGAGSRMLELENRMHHRSKSTLVPRKRKRAEKVVSEDSESDSSEESNSDSDWELKY